MSKRTVMDVLEDTADKRASAPALKVKRGGAWQTTTWGEYREQVRMVGRAFIKLGLEKGQGVSIIGYNCPEWSISDLAAIYAGGFPAGIYTTNSAEQCRYIAEHSDSVIAVVENAEQLAKFKAIRDQLPMLKAIVMIYGSDDDEGVYSWSQLPALAAEVPDEVLAERVAAQDADDVCTLIYTSGTTGDPKAVMISHDNITWTGHAAYSALGVREDDQLISYLPLSHIAEQVVTLHGPMLAGACTAYAEGLDQLGDNLREIRPTIFLGVPRVWEKIQAKMVAAGAQNSGLKKKIAAWARGVGMAAGYAEQRGQGKPLFYGLADKLVFSKVRERLGFDRCRVAITSAAPISKATLEFFLSLGIPVMEVYGMSECTGPATLSLPHKYRTGSVGWVLPGAELKIADDGEICMRGRHVFKGYYKNPSVTAETIDADGWLHSGDVGVLDSDGFLKITDRKKDLLITAGGENIAPQVIEGLLKGIDVISQAVVVGDRRKHLSALITLDETKLEGLGHAVGESLRDLAAAAASAKVHDYVMRQVEEVNKQLARVQTIKKIKILPRDLTIEDGDLTPTMKVKRKVVNQEFADLIEAFYS
ncbi:MAG: AMP-binding protein [Nannocystaceae bacterium]|nr:AMP-binding protein [Myxococcales bacterium]